MRQAIQALVQKGLVVRRRGIGTIVAAGPIKRPMALTSLYDDLRSNGRKPSTEVLDIQEGFVEAEIAREMEIQTSEPVLRIERLRLADGQPIALMHNTLPLKVIGVPLTREQLLERGLYEVLRDQGIRLHFAHQTIGVRQATAREGRLLRLPRPSAVLTMVRIAV